jgi:hypothetical protein
VFATRDLTDAFTLAALLNSPVADAWVGAVAGIWVPDTRASASRRVTHISDSLRS